MLDLVRGFGRLLQAVLVPSCFRAGAGYDSIGSPSPVLRRLRAFVSTAQYLSSY